MEKSKERGEKEVERGGGKGGGIWIGAEGSGVGKEDKKIRSVVVVESGGRVERTKGCDQKREKKMKNVIRKDESTRTRIHLVCCSTNSTNQPKGKSVVRLRSFVHSQQTISQQQHVKVK